jgi:EAL domain-containing protein (putative c-di-GMP-specific phosphodiesterase class I)
MSVFDERLHQELVSKLQLESELRRAIDEQQLYLHYQPIVDLHDERIHGFEALVRWNHPVHGRLPPKAFLPLAEEKGSSVTSVCGCCAKLAVRRRSGGAASPPMPISRSA